MLSTMQDFPLSISHILRHGEEVHEKSQVLTWDGQGATSASYGEIAHRSRQLAQVLRALGVGESTRVATFCWNHQSHLEAYLAVPSMGAVLHTLNIRLFPDQLSYVISNAGDEVVLFDASLTAVLARAKDALRGVSHLVALGGDDLSEIGEALDRRGSILSYEDLLQAEDGSFTWPEVDERQAAGMCYTSGTTGKPKGVVYSHRSIFLHSMAGMSANTLAVSERDRILAIVPMFHANAWGIPYTGWFAGADLVMPREFLQAPHLAQMIATTRPTLSAGVPTIWNDLLHYAEVNEVDFSSLRAITGGGSAVPRAMIQAYRERFGIQLLQGWGMTETSPLCALSTPPKGTPEDREVDYLAKTGRVVAGVEVRVVADDSTVLPNDGQSVGEFEVRGPWITGSYYADPSPERFHDGWLRTGDVGSLDQEGFMQISDRAKDVIKSGGEWISSVDLENIIMSHPAIVEASVVGVPDPRWEERPLACVVIKKGIEVTPEDLVEFLRDKVAKWWVPERWSVVDEIPKTSVGKFDKKVLRARYASKDLDVYELSTSGERS